MAWAPPVYRCTPMSVTPGGNRASTNVLRRRHDPPYRLLLADAANLPMPSAHPSYDRCHMTSDRIGHHLLAVPYHHCRSYGLSGPAVADPERRLTRERFSSSLSPATVPVRHRRESLEEPVTGSMDASSTLPIAAAPARPA